MNEHEKATHHGPRVAGGGPGEVQARQPPRCSAGRSRGTAHDHDQARARAAAACATGHWQSRGRRFPGVRRGWPSRKQEVIVADHRTDRLDGDVALELYVVVIFGRLSGSPKWDRLDAHLRDSLIVVQ